MAVELTTIDNITADSRDVTGYDRVVANAVILTKDNRLLLQRRGADDQSYPDGLVLFGGGVEMGETMASALCRELQEELEANVTSDKLILLGANTYARTGVRPLIVTFFWHDNEGCIGTCREDQPAFFASAVEAMTETNAHPVLHWSIKECVRRGLIPA